MPHAPSTPRSCVPARGGTHFAEKCTGFTAIALEIPRAERVLLDHRVRRTWFGPPNLGAQGGVETIDDSVVRRSAESTCLAKTRICLGRMTLRIRRGKAKGLEHRIR